METAEKKFKYRPEKNHRTGDPQLTKSEVDWMYYDSADIEESLENFYERQESMGDDADFLHEDDQDFVQWVIGNDFRFKDLGQEEQLRLIWSVRHVVLEVEGHLKSLFAEGDGELDQKAFCEFWFCHRLFFLIQIEPFLRYADPVLAKIRKTTLYLNPPLYSHRELSTYIYQTLRTQVEYYQKVMDAVIAR